MTLLILWLGIGEAQKIGIVPLVCFFPIFIGTLDGFAGADPRLVEAARSLRLSHGGSGASCGLSCQRRHAGRAR